MNKSDPTNYDNDYRFAWRWLLPSTPSIAVTGNAEANAFLQAYTSAQPSAPKIVLVDADVWAKAPHTLSSTQLQNVDCFALFGSRHAVTSLTHMLGKSEAEVRDYGLLPPRSPRMVIPLSNRASAIRGLSLHHPGSSTARWALSMLRGMAHLGILAPLRQKMLRLISHEVLRPWALNEIDIDLDGSGDFALYLGAKGPNRKTVALTTSITGDTGQIIKTAEHTLAKKKLANEARMLQRLADMSFADNIPAAISFQERASVSVLVQEYRLVTPCKAEDKRVAARRFLDLMYRTKRGREPLDSLIKRLERPLTARTTAREQIIDTLLQKASGLTAPIGITHGDFAPWNCGLSSGKLVVYDWEEGKVDGIPVDDAFSYAVFPLLLIDHTIDPKKLTSEAISFAKSIYTENDIDTRTIHACFALWCLRQPTDYLSDLFTLMAREITNDL